MIIANLDRTAAVSKSGGVASYVGGDESMPLKDSLQSEKTDREDIHNAEEIETPIEAGIQAQAEREFEKIPASCRKAIVSVNGEDVDEVPLVKHHRAA
jgi:GTP cyclohydrolase III